MSTNCIRCVKNERTSLTDLLCDECRAEAMRHRLVDIIDLGDGFYDLHLSDGTILKRAYLSGFEGPREVSEVSAEVPLMIKMASLEPPDQSKVKS